MTASLDNLAARCAMLASTHAFVPSLDLAVYGEARRDPSDPVLIAGSLDAPLCCFGRDLGRDEVRHGEPLIGGSGRKVRATLHRFFEAGATDNPPHFAESIARVLCTNTVPYKPSDNKAFGPATVAVFRPLVEELLTLHWAGTALCPLGTHALAWFRPYDPDAITRIEKLDAEQRYTASTAVTIGSKRLEILPLPHPSGLNRYSPRFGEWFIERLKSVYS
ncbi:MAG: uracil-DNA glycosylase family protein [bacterium]